MLTNPPVPHTSDVDAEVDRDNAPTLSTIGGRIRAARVKAGLTQDRLAKALDVSKRALVSWEKGDVVPQIDILPGLRHICDVDAEWIANGRDLTPRSSFGVVDWVRYDRIAADVQATCIEYGIDPASKTAIEITRSMFDEDPGGDDGFLRRVRSVLRALSQRKVA